MLDHEVFARRLNGNKRRFLGLGFPVIQMVGHKTEKMVARARQAGVTHIVEKPLLAGVLLDAINSALGETIALSRPQHSG